MHEDEPRLLSQHVTMDRGHLYAVRAQSFDHRIDLRSKQNEVAGNRRLASAGGLEADAGVHAHGSGRHELHAALCDGVAARHTDLIDATVVLALGTDDLID